MRKIMVLSLLVVALGAESQTFLNFNYPQNGTNFSVPKNSVLKIINWQAGVESFAVTYPFSTNEFRFNLNLHGNQPEILGPATLNLYDSVGDYTQSVFLFELDPVNVAPMSSGFTVQPANSGASICLETSTNLTTWTACTNGVYGSDVAARFFRMNLELQK
jgi:hypothetical protein